MKWVLLFSHGIYKYLSSCLIRGLLALKCYSTAVTPSWNIADSAISKRSSGPSGLHSYSVSSGWPNGRRRSHDVGHGESTFLPKMETPAERHWPPWQACVPSTPVAEPLGLLRYPHKELNWLPFPASLLGAHHPSWAFVANHPTQGQHSHALHDVCSINPAFSFV